MRQPPTFATDEWCWQYTMEKINGNHLRKHGYELSYEDWQPKHFMGANRIYKNVVNKYGLGRPVAISGEVCPRCDQARDFAPNDYICSVCRFGC